MTVDVDTISRNALRWADEHLEIFGGDYAGESADLYGATHTADPAPPGAFVFYRSVGDIEGIRRDWGHVGLSMGDGRVIHAWDRVRIDEASALASLSPAPGWEPLSFRGWTPLSRILEGSRPATWTTDAATAAAHQQAQWLEQDRRGSAPTR